MQTFAGMVAAKPLKGWEMNISWIWRARLKWMCEQTTTGKMRTLLLLELYIAQVVQNEKQYVVIVLIKLTCSAQVRLRNVAQCFSGWTV